jgi:hypothetical protein
LLNSSALLGGVLYVSKESSNFVPHKKNLPQHREAFELADLINVTLSLVEPRLNLLARWLNEKLPRYIEVRWNGEEVRFPVPGADLTLMKL